MCNSTLRIIFWGWTSAFTNYLIHNWKCPHVVSEGASNTAVDLPPIARASWPMQGKISSSSLLGAISSIGGGGGISSSSQHTIITIPQKEDGKKKYPQRSCRFCWRAGKRRDTRFMCQQCSVPLCKTNCFDQHQTEGFLIGWKDESTAVL